MKNILILNGHQFHEVAKGNLTQMVISHMEQNLTQRNFNVQITRVDNPSDHQQEVDKFAWADYIIFQYPVYWMSIPWMAKKYFDEVFMSGRGVIYENDGRDANDPSKKYGSGGLLKGKKHLLSITYNCPESEFNNPSAFFDGLTLDQANVGVHKVFEFCGTTPLPTFALFDIFNPNFKEQLPHKLAQLDDILNTHFN